MHWIDWTLASCPLVVIGFLIVWGRQHVRSVSDFLTGGRLAGRYLLTVSGMEASQGVIGLLAVYEAYYQSGFAYGFWEALNTIAFLVMALTGYCVYRFRETRAMTMGQFLEIRYSRRFRIFAGTLQSLSGVLNYGLFPAISGKFFVFYCGLPTEVSLFGLTAPTFALIMAAYLGIAALLATSGGQLSIMVADCVVGVLSYPMYLCVVAYLVWKFSWFHDFAPALLNRPPGHSLINPFDIAELRDFNFLFVVVGVFAGILNRMSWAGNQGFYAAGRNAHEQKMSGVLQTWRIGFSKMMYVLVPVVALAFFNSDKFNAGPRGADALRVELASKVVEDVLPGQRNAAPREDVRNFLRDGTVTPALQGMLDKTAALKGQTVAAAAVAPAAISAAEPVAPVSPDARVLIAQDAIRAVDPAASQTYATIFRQMSVPMAIRYILPVGIIGTFCAICISLLMATDASYQHSWGSIIVQDVIMPLRRTPLSPRHHLRLLRCLIVFVATFAFFFSYFFGQIDYILMFMAITGAIWLGGSGPCIVGGLYWKRGTTAGAWCALVAGSGLAVSSIIVQKYWVGVIYPWLVERQLVDRVARVLEAASSPFEPIIKWRMSADKFPINSQELFAIAMLVSLGLYVVVSLLTCRQPFNMERMLHRGKYRLPGEPIVPKERLTFRNALSKLIGIDGQYTRGDRILAWSVFIWSFVWGFGVCFGVVTVWNWISPWSNDGWSMWFYVNNFILAGVIGAVSTVWFTIGGVKDLRQLFRDLKLKRQNVLEDGHVVDHVSADEVALIGKAHSEKPAAKPVLESVKP
jgi:SSS family solute:Na+ symporter